MLLTFVKIGTTFCIFYLLIMFAWHTSLRHIFVWSLAVYNIIILKILNASNITGVILLIFMRYFSIPAVDFFTFQILHVGSQIELLCYKLTEISHNCEKEKLQKHIIDDIVGRHQRIIQFSKNIEKIFTYISLCQFVSNMLVICFISFILVVVSEFDLWLTVTLIEIIELSVYKTNDFHW